MSADQHHPPFEQFARQDLLKFPRSAADVGLSMALLDWLRMNR